MSKLVGFYPGSFDPVTNGHIDVVERACRLVDVLYVGVGIHHGKNPMLTDPVRMELLHENIDPIGQAMNTEIHVIDFDGLMIHAAKEVGATLVIRGLRDTTDYNYEMQMVGMNAEMEPSLQTVFLPSSPNVRHISATLVRQISEMGGDVAAFVPENILKALKK